MPYINFDKPSGSFGNKGSSSQLVEYLDKEQEIDGQIEQETGLRDIEMELTPYNSSPIPVFEKTAAHKRFYNAHDEKFYSKENVEESLDNNKRKLGKVDAKFYSFSVNYSQYEQKHLARLVTGRDIRNPSEFSKQEERSFINKLREHSKNSMNEYAKNFQRKGLNDGRQLVYFARDEKYRRYSDKDEKVKNGDVKRGAKKEGWNYHTHIVVSRRDREQRFKLSPQANSKGHTNNFGSKTGFNRNQFQVSQEKAFDKHFNYDRPIEQSAAFKLNDDKKNELANDPLILSL